MTGRTHLTIGIAVGLALVHITQAQPREAALIVGAAAIGGLLPDLDHPQSMLSGWIPGAGLVSLFTRHRGITHSILFCLVFPVLVSFIIRSITGTGIEFLYRTPLLCGMLSHLVADMLTPAGVPLLWPWRANFKVLPGTLLRITKWAGLDFIMWLGALGAIGWLLFK